MTELVPLNARLAADAAWGHSQTKPNGKASLVSLLDIQAWAQLDIAPEPRLLGDLITPSARFFWSDVQVSERRFSRTRWVPEWQPDKAFFTGAVTALPDG